MIGHEWSIKCSTLDQQMSVLACVDGAAFQSYVSRLTAIERAYNREMAGKNALRLPVTAPF
jgi:hypothetical protein